MVSRRDKGDREAARRREAATTNPGLSWRPTASSWSPVGEGLRGRPLGLDEALAAQAREEDVSLAVVDAVVRAFSTIEADKFYRGSPCR
jgi:hypothetical protein